MFLNFEEDRKASVDRAATTVPPAPPATTVPPATHRKISLRVPEEMSVLNPSRVLPRHNCMNGAAHPTGQPVINKAKEPEKKKVSR